MIAGVLASAETAYLLPFAPTLNSLTVVNSGRVTATFTPAATGRVPSFFVLKAASSSGTLTISGASSPLTLSGLYAPNTLYAFSVGANNVYGTTYSTSSGTIPYVYIESPGAPTNVTVTGTTTSVIVNWTAPVISGTPTSYYVKDTNQIISGTVSFGTNTITLGYGTGGASFPVNSGYSMQVRSVNNSPYNGGVSAFVTGTPSTFVPNPVVQTPTIGTATRISNTQVSVAFTAPSTGPTPTSYTVKCSNGTIFTGVASSPYTFTDTFVTGTAYTFQVLSNGTGGPSAYSSASNSVTPYPYAPPAAPTGFSLTAGAYNYANLAWSWSQGAGGPVDTFVFYDSNSAFNNSSTLGTNRAGTLSAATTPSLSFVNYVYNTGYTFYVRADGPGGSSSATTITATPNATPPPGTVTGVGISSGSATGVTVSWSAPSTGGAVTYYSVTDGLGGSTTTTSTSYTWTGKSYTSGTSYTFTVTPYNNSGAGTAGSTSGVVWTAPPATYTIWVDVWGAGGGGSQGGGGGGGGVTSSSTTITAGTTSLACNSGAGGAYSSVWNIGGTIGGDSTTSGAIVLTGSGGKGGGVASAASSPSNRGNGGSSGAPTANVGSGGSSTRGGGGGGAGGAASATANGGATKAPTGANGVAANLFPQVCGGGGGFNGGGAGTSGSGGGYQSVGFGGVVVVSWLTASTNPRSYDGFSGYGTNGSYSYVFYQNGAAGAVLL